MSGTVLSALCMLTHLTLTLSYKGSKNGDNSNLPYQAIVSIK